MSVIVLHDDGENRAVLYCNTEEAPLPWGFVGEPGVNAYDVAEDFKEWVEHTYSVDVRCWAEAGTYDGVHAAWWNRAYQGGRFVGACPKDAD